MKQSTTHEIFKNYYYFGYEDFDIKKPEINTKPEKEEKTEEKKSSSTKLNSVRDKIDKIHSIPHTSIQISKKDTLEHSSSTVKMKVLEKQPIQPMDPRLTKLKKLSISSSNSSLLRQYKQQSSNLNSNSQQSSSTGSGYSGSGNSGNSLNASGSNASLSYVKIRSNSTVNLNNNNK